MSNNNYNERQQHRNYRAMSSTSNDRRNQNAHNRYNQIHTQSRAENSLRYSIDPDEMGAQFFVNPIRSYGGAFPNFSQPREIGSFPSEKRIKSLKEKNISIEEKDANCDLNKINTFGVKYLGTILK
jgi:hypothetical protein